MDKKELVRKLIHMLFIFSIPLAKITSVGLVQILLTLFGFSCYILEQLRLKKVRVPLISFISGLVLREKEKNIIAFAPITLALGIVLVLELYVFEVAVLCIFASTFGDSAASIFGKLFSKPKLFWNQSKSLFGMAFNFIFVFIPSFLYSDFKMALVAGLVSAGVESLELEHVDNLMIPLSVGAAIYLTNLA